MITLASLLTAGDCEPQLEVHINGALNVGISPEKVLETKGVYGKRVFTITRTKNIIKSSRK